MEKEEAIKRFPIDKLLHVRIAEAQEEAGYITIVFEFLDGGLIGQRIVIDSDDIEYTVS